MLLVCDIGNSAIKCGLYKGRELICIKKFSHKNFSSIHFKDYQITECAFSSVVPEVEEFFVQEVRKQFLLTPYKVSIASKLNIKFNYQTPETLGIDRVCGAEGTLSLVGKRKYDDIIFIDLGTATTINYISNEFFFEGGLIMPGLETMKKSLSLNTAQLPDIELSNYTSIIGQNTIDCIKSGLINATIGAITKIIEHIAKKKRKIKIFVTGGNAFYVKPYLEFNFTYEENLTLMGIKNIYELNKL